MILSSSLLAAHGTQASSQEFWADTSLLDVYVGSYRSSKARDLSRGGYDLSGGEAVDFRSWYVPTYRDTTILLSRRIAPDFGIVWGLSSGESGEKYTIDPALQVGFVLDYFPFENAVVSIRATYPFFGNMAEKTCIADYGELGGVQPVNCRLAADIIPPEETLDFLVKLRGETDARIRISFLLLF